MRNPQCLKVWLLQDRENRDVGDLLALLLFWVLVKGFKYFLRCQNNETLVFMIDPYHGNLHYIPYQVIIIKENPIIYYRSLLWQLKLNCLSSYHNEENPIIYYRSLKK